MFDKLALLCVAVLLCAGFEARAQTTGCPTTTAPRSSAASSYVISTADNCAVVVLTNTGTITVSMPPAGILPAGKFSTTLLPTAGGALVLAPTGGATAPKINGQTSLSLVAGAGVMASLQQDSNWYALAGGSVIGGVGGGMLVTASNATLPTARTNLGLGAVDSPTFAGVTLSGITLTGVTDPGTAAGAGNGKALLVCGTNAGTAKIIVYAGTSTTPVTLIDNIGGGVTGC